MQRYFIILLLLIAKFAYPQAADSTYTTQPNLKLLPITLIATAICIDAANDISNINDAINQRRAAGMDYHDLEVDRNWKRITFATAAIAGAINLYISIKPIKIRSKNGMVSLVYHFHNNDKMSQRLQPKIKSQMSLFK